jgi:hypothetical protein
MSRGIWISPLAGAPNAVSADAARAGADGSGAEWIGGVSSELIGSGGA